MKIVISIPDQLFESVERFAEHQRISRSELYVTALRRYLGEHHHTGITEQLNAIYEVESSTIDSELTHLQFFSLYEDAW